MDVRMPVMDGLDATRAIRAIERERGAAAIPIIALTANASLEDMERSRKAGCNAHLCKPISKLELLSAIEKHRRQVKPVDTAQSGSRDAIRIEMPVELEDIVPGYLVSRKKEVSEMTELLAACDFERLSILSHNLKGTARGYGFPDLVKMGSALEQSANQMDSGTLSTQITDLGNYLQRVELALAGQPVYEPVSEVLATAGRGRGMAGGSRRLRG
jgi:HPt (histidine-containing phosphotransfer) domain-containing protein